MNPAARYERFDAAFRRLPLVAILRGLSPVDAERTGQLLYAEGFRLLEVPLNSPEPFASIEMLRRVLPTDAIVGAGTVTLATDVDHLARIGADLVVMPHVDEAIIRTAKALGLVCVPGVATPTEAFAAISAGADALKLFPAEMLGPPVVRALRAVLPKTLRLLPVGGIGPDSLHAYRAAGANGFGLGSALYVPDVDPEELTRRARRFVAAWQAIPA